MRKLFTTTIALAGVLGLVPLAASAAPAALPTAPQAMIGASVQHADWDDGDCGPRCQYWRHRRWEHQRAERRNEWRREHHEWDYAPHHEWHGDYR